jgi:hypothetical protein
MDPRRHHEPPPGHTGGARLCRPPPAARTAPATAPKPTVTGPARPGQGPAVHPWGVARGDMRFASWECRRLPSWPRPARWHGSRDPAGVAAALGGHGRPLVAAGPAPAAPGAGRDAGGSTVSLSQAVGAHATAGSSRPHRARLRRAPLLPRARLAFPGCWLQRAFSCRGRRPIRSAEGRTECPIPGISRGAFASPRSLGNSRLAWRHPGSWEPVRVPSIRAGSLPADGFARSPGRPARQPPRRRFVVAARVALVAMTHDLADVCKRSSPGHAARCGRWSIQASTGPCSSSAFPVAGT